jgi:large subunit ribosomal protein L32
MRPCDTKLAPPAGQRKDFAMPNPKRRHSKRRTSIRRAHDALTAGVLSECPNCHERKLPHHVCPKCGNYKGREVLEVKEAS